VEPRTASSPEAPSRRALRWQEHKESTRRELLASARKLFAERGYHATSAADIAAAAGVTERTLFRYFPNKLALVVDEAVSLLPEMFEVIRQRPAEEGPYQAVCEGTVEFAQAHRDMMLILVVGGPGALDLPLDGRQRTLIDFEDTLAEVLRDRYAVPAQDQITPAVWARASIGALRTALAVTGRNRSEQGVPKGAFVNTIRACFAALAGRATCGGAADPGG
jgi:AcrR family transcriptional regulator